MTTVVIGPVKRRGVFLRIVLKDDTVLGLWLGFGDFEAPINALDVAGQAYQGLGILVGVPQLQALLNGTSARADFSLSGVPAYIANLADADQALLRGCQTNVGICKMDDDWQIDGTVEWPWDGRCDFLSTSKSADAQGAISYIIKISVGTAQTGRSRPAFSTWTNAQHQRAHAGDTIFDHMPVGETTERWPGG